MNPQLLSHSATAVAALALLAGGSPALANTVQDVKLTELDPGIGLRPIFGSRSAVEVTFTDPVALKVDGCGRDEIAPVRLRQISMQRTDSPEDATRRFEFNEENLAPAQPCSTSTVFLPMAYPPRGTFRIVATLDDGTTFGKEGVTFKEAPQDNPSSVISFDADVLQGDKGGKLGVAVKAAVSLDIVEAPILRNASDAWLRFEGETATSGDSLAFKEALKLEALFTWRLGPIGDYYAIIAKPLYLDADDNLRTVNYRGSLGLAAEVPGTVEIGRTIQRVLGGCDQSRVNCTSFGLLVGASYGFNSKWKRQSGRLDRSEDTVAMAQALWQLPLTEQLTFEANYDWQSDSPDGSSSESYEIGATFKPWGCDSVGLKMSYINGEFLPGQQKRDAIRFGITSLLGAATGRGGC